MSRIIIISGPSGTGKGTVINRIIEDENLRLSFSISATNRQPRNTEQHGVEYYFLSEEEFTNKIKEDAFIEYVEVYPGRFYGTLKSELDRINALNRNLLLDIDVEGALKVKELYGDQVLSLFLAPPSIDTLRDRLIHRGTESMEVIRERLDRAAYELSLAPLFDKKVINDDLNICVEEVRSAIHSFLYE